MQSIFDAAAAAPDVAARWHVDGTAPADGRVFVFGSNLAGRHGKGAALLARQRFGAITGLGSGYQGWGPAHCYAIPTKDERLQVLPLEVIEGHVRDFLLFANAHPGLTFFVTRVGCALAGYKNADVAPLFAGAPMTRCSFAQEWRALLETVSDTPL